MTFNRDKTFSGKCCVDCLQLLANGETSPELTEDETAAYLAEVGRLTAGTEVTLGMFAEDHGCATNFTVTYAPTPYSRKRLTVDVRADDFEDAVWKAEFHRDVPAMARIFTRYPHAPRRHELETADDCECEQLGFSCSPCDVCGSNLGGDRYAVVFWIQPPKFVAFGVAA